MFVDVYMDVHDYYSNSTPHAGQALFLIMGDTGQQTTSNVC
jgi:hypothetical protein